MDFIMIRVLNLPNYVIEWQTHIQCFWVPAWRTISIFLVKYLSDNISSHTKRYNPIPHAYATVWMASLKRAYHNVSGRGSRCLCVCVTKYSNQFLPCVMQITGEQFTQYRRLCRLPAALMAADVV